MPYKRVEDLKAAQREYQKRRNAEANPPALFPPDIPLPKQIRSIHDILDVVEAHIREVDAAQMPPATRARAVEGLLRICLRALEISDINVRLVRIEELLRTRGIAVPVSPHALLPSPDEKGPDEEVV